LVEQIRGTVETIGPTLDVLAALAEDSGVGSKILAPLNFIDNVVTSTDISGKFLSGNTAAGTTGLVSVVVSATVDGAAPPIAVATSTWQAVQYVGNALDNWFSAANANISSWFDDEWYWWFSNQ
jgi:hypothetical protein